MDMYRVRIRATIENVRIKLEYVVLSYVYIELEYALL